jgi:VIT1/CCC1 family predicted Fe2+/Mn2+ transporter
MDQTVANDLGQIICANLDSRKHVKVEQSIRTRAPKRIDVSVIVAFLSKSTLPTLIAVTAISGLFGALFVAVVVFAATSTGAGPVPVIVLALPTLFVCGGTDLLAWDCLNFDQEAGSGWEGIND